MNKVGPRGIICPLVTPYTADEKLDESALRRQVSKLVEAGVHGVSPGGSTGEGAAVTDEELARMVEICREETPSDFPVVAGVIRNSTRAAIKAAGMAKQAGATALMVTPIVYHVLVPDEKGTYEYYNQIAQNVHLPIIIYNVIPYNEISPEVFSHLTEIPELIGIKQACGSMYGFFRMMMECSDKALIYAATDDMFYSTFDLGAAGAIAAIIAAFPKECVEIWDAVQAGDNARAKAIQAELYPLWKAISGPHFPRRLKETLKQLGSDYGVALSPNLAASEEEARGIALALKKR